MQDKHLETLIVNVKNGKDDAYEKIAEQFEPLLNAISRRFMTTLNKYGVTADSDLRVELSLALYRACKAFDVSQDGVTFGFFAKRCLENCAVSFVRKVSAGQKKEGRTAYKLRGEHTFETFFPVDEDKESVLQTLSEILSSYEYAVFSRYMEGFSASEIASELETEEKSVNNAVFRSKVKIKSVYKK